MISRILFSLVLAWGFSLRAETAIGLQCSYNIQGGDYFPWSTVTPLPFPWNDIQGVWELSSDSSIYLKARVINSTKNRKILNVSLISVDRCNKPVAEGTGFIDMAEKNVVRAILSDGIYRYQLKLGMFDTEALKLDSQVCGDSILAATVKIIGTTPKSGLRLVGPRTTAPTHNMMLKKISNDLNAICKKQTERK